MRERWQPHEDLLVPLDRFVGKQVSGNHGVHSIDARLVLIVSDYSGWTVELFTLARHFAGHFIILANFVARGEHFHDFLVTPSCHRKGMRRYNLRITTLWNMGSLSAAGKPFRLLISVPMILVF